MRKENTGVYDGITFFVRAAVSDFYVGLGQKNRMLAKIGNFVIFIYI